MVPTRGGLPELSSQRLDDTELMALRAMVEGTSAHTGEDFFRALVRNLSIATGVPNAFVAEFADDFRRVRTLAYWIKDAFEPNAEWDLRGTPCEDVLGGSLCHHPREVRLKFPNDPSSADVESYLGVPLRSASGQVLGHLCVYHQLPMPEEPRLLYLFQVFAARAAAELDRLRTERAPRTQHEQVLEISRSTPVATTLRSSQIAPKVLGQNPKLLRVLDRVERVAKSDATVIVRGETGTGKELIARAIHAQSPRAARPMITLNCAALSAGLIESELFGHERGAFTGAIAQKPGRFELAHTGTLFLDEIAELPLEMQTKLLRVVQDRTCERVGGTVSVPVDVRIICATNRDLAQMVRDQQFRDDLYYRLNVVPIELPPLRERTDDIPLLAHAFMKLAAANSGRIVTHIDEATLERLLQYPWPGNIRELQNLIERSVILGEGSILHIESELFELPQNTVLPPARTLRVGPSLLEVEREYVSEVLRQTNWVIEGPHGAASILGLHPNTLRSRLKRYNLTRPTTHEGSE